MKYPVGTRCWIAFVSAGAEYRFSHLRGAQVTVVSHIDKGIFGCEACGTNTRFVEVDLELSICCCSLVPIDDPDAGKAIEEDLARPFDPRKVGETA